MIVAGSPHQQKKSSFFGFRQSPVSSSLAKQEKGNNKGQKPRGCCRGMHDCIKMGSAVSTDQSHRQQRQHRQHHQSTSELEQQVEELKKELQKQKELRMIYRKRMERTQDYLRHCLQIAQDNGLLELMTHNKQEQHDQCLLDYNTPDVNASPQPPTPLHPHSDLTALINQAKINGWYINPNEIELQAKIGQGSTANIHKGVWRGLDVAVKCIFPDFFLQNENGVTFFAQEVDTLSRQRHRFVLQLMGACLDPPNHGWVVTEFLSMTLKEWLHGPGKRQKERSVPIPPFKERLDTALEIAQAIQYLHEQKPKVIHRDLKPSNIFLDDSKHVKVADFGHARYLSDEEMALTGETGTYVYMAPEVIRCEPYNEKSDVYSFGIILNELITGNHPYIETDYGPTRIAMEVGEGSLRPALPENSNGELGELIDLICSLWDGDASARPSFSSVTTALKSIRNNFIDNTCISVA
ncbi:serine/threonine-protein kinase STY46-like [Mangifera indica]|uniref:serine/threonine-protein kinase STY46-like n=1 Tax=Mangifera indica TaxID=29780 RepID=UPI001CFBF91D|nr:serine/threonine-protein kinase STY46-like [Mangifera indica]